jgi:hypothetical protein
MRRLCLGLNSTPNDGSQGPLSACCRYRPKARRCRQIHECRSSSRVSAGSPPRIGAAVGTILLRRSFRSRSTTCSPLCSPSADSRSTDGSSSILVKRSSRYGAIASASIGDPARQHAPTVLRCFQDGVTRHLDLCLWFDELEIRRPSGEQVPLDEFAAAGKRWWDAFHAHDPRTQGLGMAPLKS